MRRCEGSIDALLMSSTSQRRERFPVGVCFVCTIFGATFSARVNLGKFSPFRDIGLNSGSLLLLEEQFRAAYSLKEGPTITIVAALSWKTNMSQSGLIDRNAVSRVDASIVVPPSKTRSLAVRSLLPANPDSTVRIASLCSNLWGFSIQIASHTQ